MLNIDVYDQFTIFLTVDTDSDHAEITSLYITKNIGNKHIKII